MAKFSKSRAWCKAPEKSTLILEISEFRYNTIYDMSKEAPMPKANSIRLVVSIQYRLVTDRWTDRQTHDDSIYGASIASRGKNEPHYFNRPNP